MGVSTRVKFCTFHSFFVNVRVERHRVTSITTCVATGIIIDGKFVGQDFTSLGYLLLKRSYGVKLTCVFSFCLTCQDS